ncbi:rab GDP-dissociation inhibitor [Metarhizium rileyi]|uniref:Rab GDP dissociation inhibitor n=1 Tax=Metarhizium rileyi (strain RCEF 4871) TaxID=1649241 RepID=A0A167HBV9_METRR|nr:rab GDP-dissociation inhibitor [Metarhizium rileyi RCEF 4871]
MDPGTRLNGLEIPDVPTPHRWMDGCLGFALLTARQTPPLATPPPRRNQRNQLPFSFFILTESPSSVTDETDENRKSKIENRRRRRRRRRRRDCTANTRTVTMDEIAKEYDVIVLGTGTASPALFPTRREGHEKLTNWLIVSVLSVKGKKVLHIDRNDHYGGEAASVNLETLFKKHGNLRAGEEPWKKYGRLNDWNIDLVPKFLMSSGELTNILVSTDVTRYLEFKQVAGSFVQQGAANKATVAKVPSDAGEALKSPLMGIFEKRRMKSFIEWVGTFNLKDPATHKGLDFNTCTMKEVYDKFGLETTTKDFIGHAMALYLTDDYITAKGQAPEAVERIRLYGNSVARYGKSPYIYPLYGLGELPQGFARLSAIYGGTYMLNTNVDELLYDGDKASGIKATMKNGADEMKFETKAKMVLGDPSYFPNKTKVVGHVLRAICILKHPLAGTNDSDSAQLIIPQSQVGRKNDVYIACVSSAHNVCPKGYWIAIVSTIAETSANHHLELQPGLDRLGKIEEQFMGPPIPIHEPLEDGKKDNVFISKSYDATSHFETTTDDVKNIYRRCAGEELKVEGLREGISVADE